MKQPNSQLPPFIIGMEALVRTWCSHGYFQCYEANSGVVIYNSKMKRVCDTHSLRAYVTRHLVGKYEIPTKRDTFDRIVNICLAKLPLVTDPIGEYRPDIPEHFIDDGDGFVVINTCDVYIPKTNPSPDDINFVQPWLDIINGLFPNPQERKRVIQFIAHALQKPMDKPSFALLITGAQGNGKSSMFKDVLKIVLGMTYVTTFNNVSQLSTSIGAQRWARRLYCFVDDFADQTEKTSEKLKAVITQADAVTKKLYCDEVEVDVITRFIFISNEHQPIPFYDGHDRRYYAPAYAPARDVADQVDDYLNKLKSDERYRDALFRYLMAYDISDFNPHVPEETDNHKRMVGNSTSETVAQFEMIISIEKPMFINRNWYEHKLYEHYGIQLTPVQLDKAWKQINAHMRSRTDWLPIKNLHTHCGRAGENMRGWAEPDFEKNRTAWVQAFRNLSMQAQDIWLLPLTMQ